MYRDWLEIDAFEELNGDRKFERREIFEEGEIFEGREEWVLMGVRLEGQRGDFKWG